jgi:hypothetical protein
MPDHFLPGLVFQSSCCLIGAPKSLFKPKILKQNIIDFDKLASFGIAGLHLIGSLIGRLTGRNSEHKAA